MCIFICEKIVFTFTLLKVLKHDHYDGSLLKLGNFVYAVGGRGTTKVETLDLTNQRHWRDVCSLSELRYATAVHKGENNHAVIAEL